jgi:hypothetical protein
MTTTGSVEDYDELRTLSPGKFDIVFLGQPKATSRAPLSSPPDGGIFVWDEYSEEKDDGGTIIAPEVEIRRKRLVIKKGRWKRLYSGRINVKWFNAKGDGVTDDLAALKAAAGAAKQLSAVLEIPEGKYLISGTWELSGSRCNLIGLGMATVQALNPRELATLKVKLDPKTKKTKTITVSSTDKFSKGQKIQIVGLDSGNHVIGTSEVYTIESINPSENTLDLSTEVKRSYDPFDPVTLKGTFILSASYDTAVIQFNESVVDAGIEDLHVEGIGPLRFGVDRSGISFKGKDSLRCLNVESNNHPRAGVFIWGGTRSVIDDTLGDRRFYFNNCNLHDNGYAGLYGAPFFTIKENNQKVAGSVQVVGGNYSNNGPEWSGSSAYGITLNGSKTVVTGARCENNTGPQIDVHSTNNKSALVVQGCTLAWGKNNDASSPGGMVGVSGQCETLIVEGCDMDGSDAASKQEYGVSIGGSQWYRTGFGSSEQGQNQETIRVVNNVFRNMKVISDSAVYMTPWDAKSVEIIGNTFINCLKSIIIDNQEPVNSPDKFDPMKPTPSKGSEQAKIMGYDKRMIPDIVRIEQNTLIDSGDCYVTCGGIVVYSDNLFTRKYPYPDSKPTDLVSYPISPFRIGTIVGRVGRVIRRNNKASGLLDVPIYDPTTAHLPKDFHWSAGDEEINEAPVPGSFLGYVCTVEGAAGDTVTGTTATTYKNTTTIDVLDCTVFCQQQWITVAGETFSKPVPPPKLPTKHTAVRIVRVIGLGHRLVDPKTKTNTGPPAGYPGKLIVELPADNGVKDAEIKFQQALFQKISIV